MCVHFPDLDASLDNLTHVHVLNDTSPVEELVLPRHLTYCVLPATRCLHCTLPTSLTFLETKAPFQGVRYSIDLKNLELHPNLTVLRLFGCHPPDFQAPPNLREYSSDHDACKTFPSSLEKLSMVRFDLTTLNTLPNLTELNVKYWNVESVQNGQSYPNIRDLSLGNTCVTTKLVASMQLLFPKVTRLSVHDGLHFQVWCSVLDLTLILASPWFFETDGMMIVLPPHLVKLSMTMRGNAKKRKVVFPVSLMHVALESEYPRFDVAISEGSQLRTMRTRGNVFANKIQFPESLRLFHVQLEAQECFDVSWAPLSDNVDFQVIRE